MVRASGGPPSTSAATGCGKRSSQTLEATMCNAEECARRRDREGLVGWVPLPLGVALTKLPGAHLHGCSDAGGSGASMRLQRLRSGPDGRRSSDCCLGPARHSRSRVRCGPCANCESPDLTWPLPPALRVRRDDDHETVQTGQSHGSARCALQNDTIHSRLDRRPSPLQVGLCWAPIEV